MCIKYNIVIKLKKYLNHEFKWRHAMKYTQADLGRIYILRLEHGDKIPDVIEDFAETHHIESAIVHFLGGTDENSKIVVGPEDSTAQKPRKIITELLGASESVGIGTLFINEESIPKLHLHGAFGRNRDTITGCTKEGISIWCIGEVIIFELVNTTAKRKIDPVSGFELLTL
jgi:predicted DNA-binding protein with PD1-like motif